MAVFFAFQVLSVEAIKWTIHTEIKSIFDKKILFEIMETWQSSLQFVLFNGGLIFIIRFLYLPPCLSRTRNGDFLLIIILI